MEPLTILMAFPKTYWCIATLFGVMFAVQGALIKRHEVDAENLGLQMPSRWTRRERWLIHYPEYAILNFVCCLSGYTALRFAAKIVTTIDSLVSISLGGATLLIFLSLIAIVGVSGKLSYYLLHLRLLLPK